MFALLRTAIDKNDEPANYVDGTPAGKEFVEYDYKFIEAKDETNTFYQDIARLICMKPTDDSIDSDDIDYYPASYLAIVPHPNSNANVEYIMDKMKSQWEESRAVWDPSASHCVSPFAAMLIDFGCRPECEYDELEFEDIVKYFDTNQAIHDYLDNSNYGKSSWDPTDSTDDSKTRPISFAIVFDEYDDWSSMAYTLRGNASYFPTTEGDQVNKFEKDFDSLYGDSYFVKFTRLVTLSGGIKLLVHRSIDIMEWSTYSIG